MNSQYDEWEKWAMWYAFLIYIAGAAFFITLIIRK